MNVIIVGCGRVGAELALLLGGRGHDVTVIDHVGSSFGHLDPAYRGRTIEAEPLGEGVLEKAGIKDAQALATVTNSDPVNAVVAHVARTVYGVPNVVARNYDPRWLVLHEAMGLTSVSSTAWGAHRIEELLERPRLRAVFSAGKRRGGAVRAAGAGGVGGADARRPRGRHPLLAGVAHPRGAGDPAGAGAGPEHG